MNLSGHAPMLGVDLAGVTTGWVLAWNNSSSRVEVAAPGSGGGAPTDADYLVKTANGSLSAERVVTDGTYIGWDWSVAGQAKATLLSSALTSIASGTWTGATSITTLGTIATGTWQGSALGIGYGGTGQTTATAAFDALAPTTTKGDLIAHNGSDNVRVPVGASTGGYVLTPDSTQAAGVKWATLDSLLMGLGLLLVTRGGYETTETDTTDLDSSAITVEIA